MKRLIAWWRSRPVTRAHWRQADAWQASADQHYVTASQMTASNPRKVYHYCLSFRDAERAEAHRALAQGGVENWKRAVQCDRDADWWDERARQRGFGQVVQWTGAHHVAS